jgi:hypothetical protein
VGFSLNYHSGWEILGKTGFEGVVFSTISVCLAVKSLSVSHWSCASA